MDITVNGYTQHKFEVNVKNVLNAIYKKLDFTDNCFIKDDKLFICVDVGYHKSEFEDVLKSEDKNTIELFKAITLLKEYFESN